MTQLGSGGWQRVMEFDPEQRKAWCYRRDPDNGRDYPARALRGDDPLIHEAVFYGLGKLIEAQYPNGAWPVRFDRRVPTAHTWAAWHHPPEVLA